MNRHGQLVRERMLEMIAAYIAEYGWAPSISEIGDALNIASSSTTHHHLHQLEREHKLVLGGGPRMIRLLEE